jgi:hypothetical protein
MRQHNVILGGGGVRSRLRVCLVSFPMSRVLALRASRVATTGWYWVLRLGGLSMGGSHPKKLPPTGLEENRQ